MRREERMGEATRGWVKQREDGGSEERMGEAGEPGEGEGSREWLETNSCNAHIEKQCISSERRTRAERP